MKRVSKMAKRRLLIFGIPAFFMIIYFAITLFGGIYNYISLKNEEKNLKDKLNDLQEERVRLKVEIEKLNDPEYVARFAKENYLYSKDGEYVIKLDNTDIKPDLEQHNKQYYIYIVGGLIFLFGITLIKKRTKSL